MSTTIKSYYCKTPMSLGRFVNEDGGLVVNVDFAGKANSFFAEDLIHAIENELDGRFVSNSSEPTPEFVITRGPYGDIFVDGYGTYDGEITIEEAEKEIPVSKAILEFLRNEQKEKTTEESAIEDLAYTLAPGFSMNPIAVAAKFPEARRLYGLGVRAPKRET